MRLLVKVPKFIKNPRVFSQKFTIALQRVETHNSAKTCFQQVPKGYFPRKVAVINHLNVVFNRRGLQYVDKLVESVDYLPYNREKITMKDLVQFMKA